jgi:DUF4097 and DUF4098 domain-containing protein YvlB
MGDLMHLSVVPFEGFPLMRLITLALVLVLPLSVAAQDISKINGTVSVAAGQQAGNVHTVNGGVDIGAGAIVLDASTVNGTVQLGAQAQAKSLHSVNGAITMGQGAKVEGELSSTNGAIVLDSDAETRGNVSNVNGAIELRHALIGGTINTTNGSINLSEGSQVNGDIIVNKPQGWGYNRPPRIVIGPHAIVRGTLDFRRDVILQVSDTAQIGPVKGATPQRYSGDTPPSP